MDYFFRNLLILNPKSPPKIIVITAIGISDIGFFQPMMKAHGISNRKGINPPENFYKKTFLSASFFQVINPLALFREFNFMWIP